MSEATSRGRWLLIVLLFTGTALNYVDRQVLALLKPTLVAEFGWDDEQFGQMGSAFQIAAAAALLLVGWFVDRFGVRRAYGAAVAVWSAAGMAHAFAATVGQFVAARAVLAVAESVNTPAAVKASALYLPLRLRSLGLGLVNTAPNIGAILTPLLIPPLALAYGWKAAFLVTGGLGFVWLAFWLFGTRNLQIATTPPRAGESNWGALLADRRSWAVIVAKALTDCNWWFLLFWLPDFFARQFGMTQGTLGWPIAIVYTLAAAGALTSGLVFPRLLARGFSVNAARKGSMLGYALLILPVPLAIGAGTPLAAALLIGLALFAHQGFSTNIFGFAADAVPPGRVASVMAAGGLAGNLTGAGIIALAGSALKNGTGYLPFFGFAAVAYLLATLAVQLIVPRIEAHE